MLTAILRNCLIYSIGFILCAVTHGNPGMDSLPLEKSSLLYSKIFNEAKKIAIESVSQIRTSSVSEKKATQLFKKFSENKSIPFGYPIDGCYARATEMARLAEKEGIVMGKVFTMGNLQVLTSNPQYPLVQWGYHVAPVLKVKKDNKDVLMVFDPSLFDRPVTVVEWNNKMQTPVPASQGGYTPKIDVTFFTNRFQYSPKIEVVKKWNPAELEHARQTMTDYLPLAVSPNNLKTSSSEKTNNSTKGVR